MALPIRTRPRFPCSQSLWSGSSHKPLKLTIRGQTDKNHNHRKLTKLITWITAFANSMKPWAMLCRATQDGRVTVKSSDKTWSTEEGNGKPLKYFCLENPMNSMKRKKRYDTERCTSRSVSAQYAPEKSGEIAPERMKRWSQSENNAHCGCDW